MGKHASRLFPGLNTRLRRMPGRDFIRFDGREQSFEGAWAVELQGTNAATIAPGTVNKVMPKIKGVALDEATAPVLQFGKLTLDTDGRGFICVEVTFNAGADVKASDLWSIRSIEMVQVANPDTDDGLPGKGLNTTGGALPLKGDRARWPIAMLRLRKTGVLDVIQGEYFPLQHRAALKEDRRSASRHFFW